MNQTLVSLTFDDGWKSHITTAAPLLWKYKMEGTFYIISNRLDDEEFPMYMNASDIGTLHYNGHEIGCHTRSHRHLTELSSEEAWEEIVGGKKDLEKIHIWPTTFAYPFGEWNVAIVKQVREAGFFAARSIVDGLNDYTTNPWLLRCVHVVETTTPDEVMKLIDGIQGGPLWTILMFHQIESAEVLQREKMVYGTTPERLEEILSRLKENTGTRVLSLEDAMERLIRKPLNLSNHQKNRVSKHRRRK